MDQTFIIRSLTAIIGIALLYAVISKGTISFLIFILLMNLVANWELTRAFKKRGINVNLILSGTAGLLFLALIYFWGKGNPVVFFPLCLLIISSFFSAMINYQPNKLVDTVFAIFSSIYTSVPFAHILLIKNLPKGPVLLWLVFVTTWSCDTLAYITGMLFGRHRLSPKLSPKKSIEGSVGGILGSIAASIIYSMIFLPEIEILDRVAFGLLIGIFSQIGDLSASLIKRYCGIKDFSHILPGHGGILDRFDSILFSFPIAYYYIITVIQKGGIA